MSTLKRCKGRKRSKKKSKVATFAIASNSSLFVIDLVCSRSNVKALLSEVKERVRKKEKR